MLAARNRFTPVRRSEARAVLAAVPEPFKWSRLPATVAEMEIIASALPPGLVARIAGEANDDSGSVKSASCAEVLDKLPEATILHLACHGYHNPANPLDSGFVMRDKLLTVTELMNLNLPNAFFAFLSACETAKSALDQPDQAVHLAATMLFTGFKSVIGTMWLVTKLVRL